MVTYEDFVDLDYTPSSDEIVCEFLAKPYSKRAAGAIAAESSIGTWTELAREKRKDKLMAKVFAIDNSRVKIAYPQQLFEKGNIPQILSSIAGNVFGLKELKRLRLVNVEFPRAIARSFKGPAFGIRGIRKLTGVHDRPLVGTIIKPKLGLNSEEHAQVAYEAWAGGCDIVKDDENLSNQSFNKFDKRLELTLKAKRKAEKETGEFKVYMPNITAEYNEMLKRAKEVKRKKGEYIMIDVITSGFSAVQAIRNEDLGLVIHAHRAMHGAITRSKDYGVSMSVLARMLRLAGIDQLHTGTAVGKMSEDREEVLDNMHALTDEFHGIKKSMPVASGGMHPRLVPELFKITGKDIIIQAGGGIHGHPQGTRAGAKAMRDVVDAVTEKRTLVSAAARSPELKEALNRWTQ